MFIPKAYAQGITNKALTNYGSGDGGVALGGLIVGLWRAIIILGGLALIIFTVWGGLSWILAGGDKNKVESARERIIQGIIGMAVLAGSVAVMIFLKDVFKLDLLNPQFYGPGI